MSCCKLKHIPSRLYYTDDLEIIESFFEGDSLYRRINDKIKANPFGAISLTDLSHNIGLHNNIEHSKSKDVLFSIIEEDNIEIYEDHSSLRLIIKSVNNENKYDKLFYCDKNAELGVRIKLQHAPICCMYPHCVFQFFIYNGVEVEVTYDNYKSTLGQKKYKYLRDKLRQELALMIVRETISYQFIE